MKVDIWYTIEGRDKHGQLRDFRKFKAHSPVMGIIDFLAVQMGQQTLNITDVTNTPKSVGAQAGNMACNEGANLANYGIRVGTGTTAVAVTDYNLATPINQGNGSGQLAHGANSISAASTIGTSRQFTVSRTFTNNSGSSVTFNEIGLIGKIGAGPFYILMDRTLSTNTINNTLSKTVTCTIKVTV